MKYMGNRFNIMTKCTGSKTSAEKIKVWNGAQYLKEVTMALRKMLNCEAPRGDQIANFWLKQLTETHTNTWQRCLTN
jgi:hypothetical protein